MRGGRFCRAIEDAWSCKKILLVTSTALLSVHQQRAECQKQAEQEWGKFNSAIVIGGGVVGVATAYRLARQGLAVTVLDANAAVGRGTSQVNACSLRHTAGPINNPKTFGRLIKAVVLSDPVFHFDWTALMTDLDFWRFAFYFCRNTIQSKYYHHAQNYLNQINPIAIEETVQIATEEGIVEASHLQQCGSTEVFVDSSERYEAMLQTQEAKQAIGLEMQVLTKEELLKREPCLKACSERISGAIHFPGDWIGMYDLNFLISMDTHNLVSR